MSAQQRLTRDQRREIAREQARAEREARLKRERRNKILIRGGVTLGIVGLLAAIALGFWAATRGSGPGPLNMASGGLVLTGADGEITPVETPNAESVDEIVPTDPDDFDAPVHIVTYLDYLCPYCGMFETANGAYLEELVASGQAALEVHPVTILDRASQGSDYSTRAASAAGCVAEYAPESFLDFNAAMFAQQPAEGTRGLDNDQIAELAANAGADSEEVAACIRETRFSGWFKADTKRVLGDDDLKNPATGSFGTPTIMVNGERYTGAIDNPAALAAFLADYLPEPEDDTEE